ncbi:dipeptide epimerase [Henriciella mobilis]|uniref:N-acetyl-D-Glu racemase DgcA n=1 Tax=Henriciella mobilis TaxID=2305467 RepID=UPI000E671885|nr:N-acetyl-D-Glu racemase DgcA [Henriciella mobilis]RIJ14267.1 dipeptide epimerase [Henriciella mobilis]RIJ19903.1 dipeptide epimerase [Henriciella mobilis]
MTKLELQPVSSPLRKSFAISRGAKTSAETIRVSLKRDGKVGVGECVPYGRYGETTDSVAQQIETMRSALADGMDRLALQDALPPGAARCAVDCAFWDLEAKLSGKPAWELAGLPEPQPLATAVTISLAPAEEMANAAAETAGPILKLKLGGAQDIERVKAVHDARPDAKLILDANEGLDAGLFPGIVRSAAELGVVMIEQPFPAGEDGYLLKRPPEVAICADESMHTSKDIQDLARLYDVVNIKLDKTGGLTEALAAAREAKAAGLGVMVGCMVAGSISMAPAVLLGMLADAVDLDGPLWLAHDVEHGLKYEGGKVFPPSSQLWG